MKVNKSWIVTISLLMLTLICVPAIYTILKSHNEKLVNVVEKKVTEAAKKCYYESKCNSKIITLKELYAYNYLNKVFNPITKEEFNEDSYVDISNNNNYVFVTK